jgi:3-dehydroshikimate dehydratase
MKLVALSAYLDLTDFSSRSDCWRSELAKKMAACEGLDIPILRLFTGRLSGYDATDSDWARFFARLHEVQAFAEKKEKDIVFETHPGTLLDSKENVDRFVEEVDRNKWSRIGLNFDAFHVWEFGTDPVDCLEQWNPFVKHVHLKNASGRTRAFDPANVFSPSGIFDDLTPLPAGAVRIAEIVAFLMNHGYSGAFTVEWLGRPEIEFLRDEVDFLNSISDRKSLAVVRNNSIAELMSR